jgi:hypothetical protein
VLIEDATRSMTCMQRGTLDVERAAVDLAVLYVDHDVLRSTRYRARRSPGATRPAG